MPGSFSPLPLFQLPLLLSAVVLSALALGAWRQRSSPVALPFAGICVLGALWAVDYAVEIAFADVPHKVLVAALRVPIVAALPITGLALALRFSQNASWLSWRRIAALWIEPLIGTGLALTSTRHSLWRYDYHLTAGGPFPRLLFHNGWWYWLHAVYLYAVIFVTFGLLIRAARDSSALYARRTLLMLGGLGISFIPSALFDLGITPLQGYNVAPSVFWLSGLVYAWGMLRERVLEVVPIARSLVMDQLRDAVLVLDPYYRIVDANSAAEAALAFPAERLIGQPATSVFARWEIDFDRYRGRGSVQEQHTVGEGTARRVLSLSLSPIERAQGAVSRILGYLVVLHDVTDRERAREATRAAAALDAEREAEERTRRGIAELLHGRVQNHLLLVWHRLGLVERQWSDAPEAVQTTLRQARDEIDRIREQEIRLVSHRLYPALLTVGLVPAIRALLRPYESHMEVALEVDDALGDLDSLLDNRLPMALRETAYRVVEEALGNVEKHAHASRVTIGLGVNGGRLALQVHDNGRGCEPAEIASGLGLRTIAGRVLNLGGDWHFTSAPGAGATLSISLPLTRSVPKGDARLLTPSEATEPVTSA